MPSTALDTCGLLRTAIRCDDPVMFLEHKHLYRQPYNRSQYPGPDFTIPFGKARLVREGSDISVITYGALVHRAEVAAAALEREGVSLEIIDLRSLSPYDWEAIAASVRKTSRVHRGLRRPFLVGLRRGNRRAHCRRAVQRSRCAGARIAAKDVFCAYQPTLEAEILPQSDDIVAMARSLAAF